MRIHPIVFAATVFSAAAAPAADFAPVACEGSYRHHLQGVCADEAGSFFWSFTSKLVKTDRDGKVVRTADVAIHHGDLCHVDGKLYVAVNLGEFNDPKGNADSWVYVYDADDLSLLAKRPVPEAFHGAGGIAHHDGRFMVVGGLPNDATVNYVYEYDRDFKFVRRHALEGGHTNLGIQTAAFGDGHWWFGCYGTPAVNPAKPPVVLKADEALGKVERFDFDASIGILAVGEGRFLIARGKFAVGTPRPGDAPPNTGRLAPAVADAKLGLKLVDEAASRD